MYGTKLSNAHVTQLIEGNVIQFFNFERSNLKLAHYRLRPSDLWRPLDQKKDGSHRKHHVHSFDDGPYTFSPREYLIVTTLEHIILPDGMIGEVVGASTLIEQCFSLVAGKLDPGYGELGGKVQTFIMGIQNLLDSDNRFHPDGGVANISFTDFRGTKRLTTQWSTRQLEDFSDRELQRRARAEDDGPFYVDSDDH